MKRLDLFFFGQMVPIDLLPLFENFRVYVAGVIEKFRTQVFVHIKENLFEVLTRMT